MEINKFILTLVTRKGKIKTSDILKSLNHSKSRQYISFIIRGMVKKGLLLKGGVTAGSFYVLPQNARFLGEEITIRLKRENLDEHKVFDDLIRKAVFLGGLHDHITNILFYAFTEMLNNAIEHSRSSYIEISIRKDKENIIFHIKDFGIGVFRNVMGQRKLNSELEAIQDLLKGKTTTQPHSHTGEGIFFTSKIADIFILESYEYRLRVDNKIKDYFIEELHPPKKGTFVTFILSMTAEKHLNDVFKKFVTEPDEAGFDKTEIRVRLYTAGTVYISRSQARRILSGLDRFKTIILDFDKVTTVGQAFADEVFRVFQNKHKEIKMIPIHMTETVKFMINRARKP